MSRSLNRAQLIGHVGGDPDVRTAGTTRVAQFSLATDKQWTDNSGTKQSKTEWHRCVAWNNTKGSGLADIVEKYVRKGEKIYVEGEIEYRQWQDKDGQTRYTTEIRVRELMLLGGKSDSAEQRQERPVKAARLNTTDAPRDVTDILADDDDDGLPF